MCLRIGTHWCRNIILRVVCNIGEEKASYKRRTKKHDDLKGK